LFGPGQPVEVAVDDDTVKAVVYKSEQIAEEPGEQFHRNFTLRKGGRPWGEERSDADRASERSAAKIFGWPTKSATSRAAPPHSTGASLPSAHSRCFSTDTGDAWLLDPADHLAARLARDGDPEPIHFEETETNFAIRWKGNYSVDGAAFVFIDNDSARIVTILGYPTGRIAQLG